MSGPGYHKAMAGDYHLLKRKIKKGTKSEKTVYHAAFLSDEMDERGRRKYRSIRSTGQTNVTAAHKEARKMMQEGSVFASGDDIDSFLLNFWDPERSEYLKAYEGEHDRKMSPVYIKNSQKAIEKYFLPYAKKHGIRKLSDLSKRNLTAWRTALREQKVSARTINQTRQAVWRALAWAVEMDLLPYHPGQYVKPVPEKKAERKIFEIAELTALFKVEWPDPRARAACLLSATTGARMGEVRGLLVRDTHLKDGYIDIVSNYQDTEGLKEPKWGSKREGVPIPARTVEAIKEALRYHRFGAEPDHLVFASVDSPTLAMSKNIIGKALKDAIGKAKLKPGRTFHDLRHSYISHIRGHVPDARLLRIVGHSNVSMTDHYSHSTDEDRAALKSAFSGFLE